MYCVHMEVGVRAPGFRRTIVFIPEDPIQIVVKRDGILVHGLLNDNVVSIISCLPPHQLSEQQTAPGLKFQGQ